MNGVSWARYYDLTAITVHEVTPVLELANVFSLNRINRVPITDVDGRLVDVVSREDLLKTPLLFIDSDSLGRTKEST